MSLSEIATTPALVRKGLSSEESMSVQLLSIGLRTLVGICIEEKKGQDGSRRRKSKMVCRTSNIFYTRTNADTEPYSPSWENQYHWLRWLSRLVVTNRQLFINLKEIVSIGSNIARGLLAGIRCCHSFWCDT